MKLQEEAISLPTLEEEILGVRTERKQIYIRTNGNIYIFKFES